MELFWNTGLYSIPQTLHDKLSAMLRLKAHSSEGEMNFLWVLLLEQVLFCQLQTDFVLCAGVYLIYYVP